MAMKHATSKLRHFDDLYNQNDRNAADDVHDGGEGTSSNDNDGECGHAVECAPTLGFRGEALFCLTNLSRSLVVSTRTADDDTDGPYAVGEQFAFDSEGRLMAGSVRRMPRQVGTSVTVNGLFERVPVRRVDMRKRIAAQGTKLVKMMQGCKFVSISEPFDIPGGCFTTF